VNDAPDAKTAAMTLSDGDLERYARHVIIPGVGVSGQARLLRARVAVAGHGSSAAICTRYLERCGVTIVREAAPPPDCYTAVGIDEIDETLLHLWGETRRPLVWVALRAGRLLRGYEPAFDGVRPMARRRREIPRDLAAETAAACDAANRVLSALLGWEQRLETTELLFD